MARMNLSGAMYLSWVQLMQDKVDALTAAASAMNPNGDASSDKADDSAVQAAEAAARSKAQFEAMKQQAQRVESIRAEMHVDTGGMVITSQTTLK
jgi:hypothetical protein